METSFFEGPGASARPPAAVESLPALHLLERGGIIMTTTTADGEASADLAISGRRHSSLDSARSTVQGREACDVMSEDEAGLLKQQPKNKQQQVCGSKLEETRKKREVEATRAAAPAAAPAAAKTAAETAAAAAAAPPPSPAVPQTQDGAERGGRGGEQHQQQQAAATAPPPASLPPPPPAPLNPLLSPAAAAALAAARAPSSSPDFVCCDPAVPAFIERHSRVAARLAAALDSGPADDSSREAREAHDAELLSLVGECAASVRALWDARCAALDAGRVAEVAAGAFVHPGQRLLAWMGGIRPSDYLSCARAMLAVWGEALEPGAAAALSQLQAAVAEQQASMSAAFTELSERLARTAAVARYVRASCAAAAREEDEAEEEQASEEEGKWGEEQDGGGGGGKSGSGELGRAAAGAAEGVEEDGSSSGPSPRSPGGSSRPRPRLPRRRRATPRAADRLLEAPSPAASGIVDDMRALLKHADELRALVAQRVSEPPPAGLLTPRQQALFWLCVQDIIELDARPTPRARPRASFLGGGGGLTVRRPPEGARGG